MFEHKDFSNNTEIFTSWNIDRTSVNPPQDSISHAEEISILRKNLELLKLERDKWQNIAKTISWFASKRPHNYYGRTVEYIIDHAEKNL